jgi:hypothetical protein
VKVYIKEFDVEMQLKYNGIELDVADTRGNHIGDLIINKARLTWCPGRVRGKNGKQISWDEFIAYMNSRP